MDIEDAPLHPADRWAEEALQLHQASRLQLRLAAMAGQMRVDKIAARRAALIDLLADGRPHHREEIWQAVARELGPDCWGKVPQEALARDLATLRQGGIRIGYSRRPKAAGYYLEHPPLARPSPRRYGATNWALVRQLRRLSVLEKNERAFAAAEFALTQKRLILAEAHPEWSSEEVERVARRQVFGAVTAEAL